MAAVNRMYNTALVTAAIQLQGNMKSSCNEIRLTPPLPFLINLKHLPAPTYGTDKPIPL